MSDFLTAEQLDGLPNGSVVASKFHVGLKLPDGRWRWTDGSPPEDSRWAAGACVTLLRRGATQQVGGGDRE